MTELANLTENPEITEILINNHEEIWVEKHGHLNSLKSLWSDEQQYSQFVRKILDFLNSDLSLHEPFCSGRIGNFRVQIVGPPVCQIPTLSLRRISTSDWDLKKWRLSQQTEKKMQALVRDRKNILIFGSTGSGKTTLLSSLLKEVEANERVLVLEDNEELSLPNAASLRLLSRKDPAEVLKEISLTDLIKHSLRMRPDRLALGEVRGPEAKDLLMALATGHQGSFGTLHAHTLTEALLRLEMLVQLGAPQWENRAIRQLIRLSIHAVVGVSRLPNGERTVTSVDSITGLEEFGFLTESSIDSL